MKGNAATAYAVTVLLIAISTAPGATAALDREGWAHYDASVGGPFASFELATDDRTWRVGGVAFEVHTMDDSVFVSILDDSGLRAPARYVFADAAGGTIASGALCSNATLDVPSGAASLRVYPSPLVTPCPLTGPYGPATSGYVYAAFHS